MFCISSGDSTSYISAVCGYKEAKVYAESREAEGAVHKKLMSMKTAP